MIIMIPQKIKHMMKAVLLISPFTFVLVVISVQMLKISEIVTESRSNTGIIIITVIGVIIFFLLADGMEFNNE